MIEAEWIRLYRAVPTGVPYTGYESWWTSSPEHARHYAERLGAPHLITALVELGAVLDLRADLAGTLAGELGIDRDDYRDLNDLELAVELSQVFGADYTWVVLATGDDQADDEWLYLEDAPIQWTSLDQR